MRYKKAVFYAFISGILFILTNWRIFPWFWKLLTDWLTKELPEYENFFRTIFVIIFILAAFGGITVILGGIAISKEHLFTGRFLIIIGAGIGLITLIILFIFVAIIEGLLEAMRLLFTLQGLAVILAILARRNAKKKKRWK
ncbi:MAG: hypothetical protein Q6362_012065 [Candidatus Wukongarchaeota archaeon]|nr:hypothetical protein [Candidatus Wukongarchaeota archaeon]MDO8130144.1 hypothetical protein [Candidatus Wukongarchaeota archaeon]